MICFLQIIRIILISQPFAKGMVRNAIVKRTDEQDFFSTNEECCRLVKIIRIVKIFITFPIGTYIKS